MVIQTHKWARYENSNLLRNFLSHLRFFGMRSLYCKIHLKFDFSCLDSCLLNTICWKSLEKNLNKIHLLFLQHLFLKRFPFLWMIFSNAAMCWWLRLYFISTFVHSFELEWKINKYIEILVLKLKSFCSELLGDSLYCFQLHWDFSLISEKKKEYR